MKKCLVCKTDKYLSKKYSYPEGRINICQKCQLAVFQGSMPKSAGVDIAEENPIFKILKKIVLNYEFGFLKKEDGVKILEIGSGSGELAKILNNWGHRVVCNDVDKTSLKRIFVKYKFDTLFGSLEKLKIKRASFDAVIMRHVFEHINNHNEFIHKIHSVLKKNGRLIITQPNSGSFCCKSFGKHWSGFSVPAHRYSWNISNLSQFLRKNDFRIEVAKTIFSHYGFPLNLLFVFPRFLKIIFFPLILICGLIIELFSTAINRGQNLFIIAKKI